MEELIKTLKTSLGAVSGLLSPILIIASFSVAVIKPIRTKFIAWISRNTNTHTILERVDKVDTKVNNLKSNIDELGKKLIAHDEESTREMRAMKESQLISLRGHIREIYRRNLTSKSLSLIEQRDIHDFYEAYEKLKGNGYIRALVEEMDTWNVYPGIMPSGIEK